MARHDRPVTRYMLSQGKKKKKKCTTKRATVARSRKSRAGFDFFAIDGFFMLVMSFLTADGIASSVKYIPLMMCVCRFTRDSLLHPSAYSLWNDVVEVTVQSNSQCHIVQRYIRSVLAMNPPVLHMKQASGCIRSFVVKFHQNELRFLGQHMRYDMNTQDEYGHTMMMDFVVGGLFFLVMLLLSPIKAGLPNDTWTINMDIVDNAGLRVADHFNWMCVMLFYTSRKYSLRYWKILNGLMNPTPSNRHISGMVIRQHGPMKKRIRFS